MNEAVAFLLIFIYASCSATYVFYIKTSSNRLVYFGALNAVSLLFGLILVWFVPLPTMPMFLSMAGSVLAYNVMLFFTSKLYARGDLSAVAPIYAAFKFLLLLAMIKLFFSEQANIWEWVGIGGIVAGIFVQVNWTKLRNIHGGNWLGYSLCAAVASSFQQFCDIHGMKVANDPFSYIVWIMMLGVPVTVFAFLKHRREIVTLVRAQFKPIIISSILDNVGYACFLLVVFHFKALYALPMGNLSIVLATFIGLFILKESYKARRITASIIIALSIALIQAAPHF